MEIAEFIDIVFENWSCVKKKKIISNSIIFFYPDKNQYQGMNLSPDNISTSSLVKVIKYFFSIIM